MTEALCRCKRPIHDTAYVCSACAAHLGRRLADVARIAGDITLTVAKLGKVTRRASEREVEHGWHRGPGALYPMPLIVDLDAAARHDAAAGELATWARHIASERGTTWTQEDALPVLPGRLRPSGDGLWHETWRRSMHPLAAVAGFLATSLDWLRYRQESEEAWPALLSACLRLERVVDTAPREAIVGRCPCGRWLYAAEGSDTVRCWGCAERYDVAASRDGLRADLEGRDMTGAQIAVMAGYLGIADSKKARLMIKVWAGRGKLEAREHEHGKDCGHGLDGGPVYRFGDALPLLLVAYARVG